VPEDGTKKLLGQILDTQRRILQELETDKKQIDQLRKELTLAKAAAQIEPQPKPALVRILKGLADLQEPVGADEISDHLEISRSVASGYLNRLAELGYVQKLPNMEGEKKARYVFKLNEKMLSSDLKRLVIPEAN